MDTRKLFEYSQALRNRYLEQIASLPWAKAVESRGASFDCLRDILLHTIDAEDRLVNYVITGRAIDWTSRNPDEFQDMDSVRKRAREVETTTRAYVENMKPEELEKKVELPRRDLPSLSVPVEDILVHAALENIHHFGELIALLWQTDVEPSHLGWIGYLQR
jgi:uncharacterized damage-inducible protein DinB